MAEPALVDALLKLRQAGVTDAAVLEAIERTQRAAFLPGLSMAEAYGTAPVPIAAGQTAHSVVTVGRFIDAARIQSGHNVLDIGTGSGFLAAVAGRLARKVHSVERYATLVASARRRMADASLDNVLIHHGDGRAGLSGQGVFDRIVTTLAYEEPPRALIEHLASGGAVICPIGAAGTVQTVFRFTKIGSRYEKQALFEGRFGPFGKGVAAAL